jgi:hypothetical protein
MPSGFISSTDKSPAAGAAAPDVVLAAAEEVADDAAEVAADELAEEDFDDESSSLPQPASANPTTTPATVKRRAVCLCRAVMRSPLFRTARCGSG